VPELNYKVNAKFIETRKYYETADRMVVHIVSASDETTSSEQDRQMLEGLYGVFGILLESLNGYIETYYYECPNEVVK
jgi:hypothetical protein